jgi:cysteine desulfurase
MHAGNQQAIYLDFNASTPLAPEVARAMEQALRSPFGSPSSDHWAGQPAREAVDKARGQVASLLGCKQREIVFTSGRSESKNHALKGVVAHSMSATVSDWNLSFTVLATKPAGAPAPRTYR